MGIEHVVCCHLGLNFPSTPGVAQRLLPWEPESYHTTARNDGIIEKSFAAKHQHLTRRDMQQTMQTGGPSSAKIELADGVDAKKEKRASRKSSLKAKIRRR